MSGFIIIVLVKQKTERKVQRIISATDFKHPHHHHLQPGLVLGGG
jgi:hypothetical protein